MWNWLIHASGFVHYFQTFVIHIVGRFIELWLWKVITCLILRPKNVIWLFIKLILCLVFTILILCSQLLFRLEHVFGACPTHFRIQLLELWRSGWHGPFILAFTIIIDWRLHVDGHRYFTRWAKCFYIFSSSIHRFLCSCDIPFSSALLSCGDVLGQLLKLMIRSIYICKVSI